jgi:hypothetical protein
MTCIFRLMTADGVPADPPTLVTVASSWRPGDTIPLGRRTLRVVEVRGGDADVGCIGRPETLRLCRRWTLSLPVVRVRASKASYVGRSRASGFFRTSS